MADRQQLLNVPPMFVSRLTAPKSQKANHLFVGFEFWSEKFKNDSEYGTRNWHKPSYKPFLFFNKSIIIIP